MKIDYMNAVDDVDCNSTGSNCGYGLIADRKVVMSILIRWPEEGRGLASGEPNWPRRSSENPQNQGKNQEINA